MSFPRTPREHLSAKWGTDSWPFSYLLISSCPLMPVCLVLLRSSHYLLTCPSPCHSCHSHSCFLSITDDTVCASSKNTQVSLLTGHWLLSGHFTVCSHLCRRVSTEGGQSSWLTVRPVCQQSWTVPLLSVLTKLPSLNPQGEPWPEGCWRGWPSHSKCP